MFVLHSGLLHAQLTKVRQPSTAAMATPAPTANSNSTTASDVPEVSEPKPPPAKKARGLFSHYKSANSSRDRPTTTQANPQQQLLDYIAKINDAEFDEEMNPLPRMCEQFPLLKPLFDSIFCAPASSAPVERVFSKSGLIMRPNRAKMSDSVLETLVFLTCNRDL
jgi:hypothetical protein